MCKKLIYLVCVVLLLGSTVQAADIKWIDLGADHLWSTPENWDLGRVPALDDEVLIDVPAAAAPNGPVIQDGIDAKAKGIWTEAPGEPTLTMTGGTLEVAEWIWWGDGADSFGIWDMSGGAVTTGSEFELGWGGGAGTLTMTGGTISAFEAVIPTGSGAFGELFLYGGTYNVTKAGGLEVNTNGIIDITEGTLVLEGDDTVKVNDLIAAGSITAYGGSGKFELDFDSRNAGKTTLTATAPPEPVDPGTDGLAAAYVFEADAADSSGNALDGTLLGDAHVADGVLVLDGDNDAVAIPGTGDGQTEFTFSMMVYPTVDVTPLQFSGGLNTDSWPGGVHLKLNNGNINVGVNGLAGGDVVGTSIVEPDMWTHLALTVSPDEVAVYVNGVKEGSRVGETVPAVNVGAAAIGAWNNNGTDVQREMTGMMDDVLIYNRALSEGEIRYLAGFRRTTPENLVLNPSFEEDEPILDDPDWLQWATWNPAEGAGSNATVVDTDAVDGARSLRIEPVGPESWHFIVLYLPMIVDMEKDYTASFWAKADEPRPLTLQMKATDNSINAWGATDFDLTTEWAEYSYTSEVLIDDVKLEILCAGSEVPFLLDQVSVVEADTLSGLADITVVDDAIASLRLEGTEYIVADGDLLLGTTTRWYVADGVETLWAEGDPAPAATVSGTSSPKEGDVGSKADNFNFKVSGSTNISSIDGIDFQETIFPVLSDTIIVFERNGNDVGTMQAIYADGSLGAAVAFVKSSDGGPYASTGVDVNGQTAYGVVFKTSVPVQGVRITASGHDALSISTPAP